MQMKPKDSSGCYTYIRKIEFKLKTNDRQSHYIIIWESVHQEGVLIINIYAPNLREPKYIKQILIDLKKEIESNT